jgi:hypothetical protein
VPLRSAPGQDALAHIAHRAVQDDLVRHAERGCRRRVEVRPLGIVLADHGDARQLDDQAGEEQSAHGAPGFDVTRP